MKRFLIGMTLALALAGTTNGLAAPSATLTKQVHVLLDAPEHTPSAQEWQKLGPDAAEVLRAVAMDGKALMLKRGRAATALRHFKSDASRQALTAVVADGKAFWILRGKAAQSLAKGYPLEATAALKPLLASNNKRLREVAIKALGVAATAEGREALRERGKVEPNDALKALIRDTLKALDAAKGAK